MLLVHLANLVLHTSIAVSSLFYVCLQVNSKAVQQLSQLFVQYEPQLLRAGDNPADVSPLSC